MGILNTLTYTRPRHVTRHIISMDRISTDSDSSKGTLHSEGSEESEESGRSVSSAGIPSSLAFERIMNGGTCPPMTVRDFMNYLVYVEHGAENLQFFLWYQDYVKRFEAAGPKETSLAPEWTQAMNEETILKIRKENVDKMHPDPKAAEIFKGSDFEKQPGIAPPARVSPDGKSSFSSLPRSQTSGEDQASAYAASTVVASTTASTYRSQASAAFQSAGAKQPFTIQPFREEINRIIATYIMHGGPRQLNLSSWEQKATVQALSYTTHPSALRGLVKTVETSLRCQSHPNFVRWAICNGNPARVTFARGLGVFLILAGFAVAIVLTLSNIGRGYRALAAIGWVMGISTLMAAYKGMCVVLHGLHHRHVRPWELFEIDDDEADGEKSKLSFESFGSNNSYEDEPWVVKYKKRNVIRKIFDREVWIQEPALRQIQDTIFIQAVLAGVTVGGILTVIFVLVPGGDFF